MKQRNPWSWIPTLYFAEALPYVAVMTIAVIMYKRLGISNTDIALYTGWLYLPWVIKPFWSPFVDLFKTKRDSHRVCCTCICYTYTILLPDNISGILDNRLHICYARHCCRRLLHACT